MNKEPNLFRIGRILLLFLFLAVILIATYFLTSFFYEKIGWHPSMIVTQLINSLLGLYFSTLILIGLGKTFQPKQKIIEKSLIKPILTALEKISLGDYDIKLENNINPHFPEHGLANILRDGINKMALELSKIEIMRQEFITNVSHEIQSPLTSIRGFARALHSNDLDPEEREHYLNIIESESIRLSKLSNNLLQLASLDSKDIKPELTTYRLDKQIKNLVLACEPQWMEKEIDMDVSLEKVNINADADLLSQVWTNLLHNSIKFTPRNGKVKIDLREKNEVVQFKISDSGIGISDADLPHIFERFFKADKSRQRLNTGNGLGLSIAKKIIKMHHGAIDLESQLGIGSTFTVVLPP